MPDLRVGCFGLSNMPEARDFSSGSIHYLMTRCILPQRPMS
ncbi:hypothetical protein OIU84_028244 [Salix udensis]|uniref:Uncharacterized protein n=1 Tax=Salix udensis TaxID=889485 RepID=A0AAD6KC72_9ROSI|nr:hypothetical protein OIU84_028244 [Salix udensis]